MKCTKCNTGMYTINTREVIFGDKVKNHDEKLLVTQARQRTYVCPECGRRYRSMEMLFREPYKIKPISPDYLARLSGVKQDD